MGSDSPVRAASDELHRAVQRAIPRRDRRDGDWYPSEVNELIAAVRPLIEAEARADERRQIAAGVRAHGEKLRPVNPARPAYIVIADQIERGEL